MSPTARVQVVMIPCIPPSLLRQLIGAIAAFCYSFSLGNTHRAQHSTGQCTTQTFAYGVISVILAPWSNTSTQLYVLLDVACWNFRSTHASDSAAALLWCTVWDLCCCWLSLATITAKLEFKST